MEAAILPELVANYVDLRSIRVVDQRLISVFSRGLRCHFPHILCERGAEIALTAAWDNDNNELAFVFGSVPHLDSRLDSSPGRNAGDNAFFP